MGKKEQIIYGSPMIVTLFDVMRKFHRDQLSRWALARRNTRALKHCQEKCLDLGKLEVVVQYNPFRAISSKAPLDKASIQQRPCFLCRENRPAEQVSMGFEGAKGKKYDILANPYPILQNHLIVASDSHVPQSIWHRYVDMLRLSKRAEGFTFLYNGPQCGASAPDHFHFQAVPSGMLPLEIQARDGGLLKLLTKIRDAELYLMDTCMNGVFVIKSDSSKSASKLFYRLLDCAPIPMGDNEPRVNIFTCRQDGRYLSIVVMRACHRPSNYYSDDPAARFAMSPGCVDMGGIFITVEKSDFERLTPEILNSMLSEITISVETQQDIVRRLTRNQTELQLEILKAETIDFEILSYGVGRRTACLKEGKLEYGGILYDQIMFEGKVSSTMFAEPSFIIHDIPGAEAGESREFAGGLKLLASGTCVTAVNVIGIEDYLLGFLAERTASCTLEETEKIVIRTRTQLLQQMRESGGRMKLQGHYSHASGAGDILKKAIDLTWGLENANI